MNLDRGDLEGGWLTVIACAQEKRGTSSPSADVMVPGDRSVRSVLALWTEVRQCLAPEAIEHPRRGVALRVARIYSTFGPGSGGRFPSAYATARTLRHKLMSPVSASSIDSSTRRSSQTGMPASLNSTRVRSVTAPTRTSAGIIRSLNE